jgi:two-component sensor histidine kinase
VQNAVEHGVSDGGAVTVRAVRLGGDGRVDGGGDGVSNSVRLDVADDGPGLPSGFDPENSDRLGLRIVRTLVVGDLGGTLEFGAEPGGGLCVSVLVPLPA